MEIDTTRKITIGAHVRALTDLGYQVTEESIADYAAWAQLAQDEGMSIEALKNAPPERAYAIRVAAILHATNIDENVDYEAVEGGAWIRGRFYRRAVGEDAMAIQRGLAKIDELPYTMPHADFTNAIGALCADGLDAFYAEPVGVENALMQYLLAGGLDRNAGAFRPRPTGGGECGHACECAEPAP